MQAFFLSLHASITICCPCLFSFSYVALPRTQSPRARDTLAFTSRFKRFIYLCSGRLLAMRLSSLVSQPRVSFSQTQPDIGFLDHPPYEYLSRFSRYFNIAGRSLIHLPKCMRDNGTECHLTLSSLLKPSCTVRWQTMPWL